MKEIPLPKNLLLKDGVLIDVKRKQEFKADILISEGKIKEIGLSIKVPEDTLIQKLNGAYILPGLIDLHCHLREPGREDEETISSGALAALAGGFTLVCCMPNTEPPIDNVALVKFVLEEEKRVNYSAVLPVACATKNRAGKEMAEIGLLKEAGACAISDDGSPISNPLLLRTILEYAKSYDIPLISHCESLELGGGVMNEGALSFSLGLPGIPDIAEAIMVIRDLMIAEYVKGKIHLAHISSKKSVEAIRFFKERGFNFTSETAPHYFSLTEEAVREYNTQAKVNPPLRREEDREAIKIALKEGLIECIATDHAPHLLSEKDQEFEKAPFGMIGLETAFLLSYEELVLEGYLTLLELVEKFTINPAKVLGITFSGICEGAEASLVIFDPNKIWRYTANEVHSRSKNTPFLNKEFKGKITSTIFRNRIFQF